MSQSNGESELSNCLFVEDVLFISSDPYVGIHMTKERKDRIDPKMPFDVGGRVFFQAGEDGLVAFCFPLHPNIDVGIIPMRLLRMACELRDAKC